MTDASRGAHLQAGLIRIELPRVRVERHGLALETVDPLDPPPGPGIRELTEVAAAADRNVDATETDRRSRYLQQYASGPMQDMRMPWRLGNTVSIVVNRKNTRVVEEALFDQDVQRPEARLDHGIAWRPKSHHANAGRVLDRRSGRPNVLAKLGGRQQVQELVVKTVRRHFVASLGDPTDKSGNARRDPAQNEKRAPDICAREEFQQAFGIGSHPALEPAPPGAGHDAVERRHMEIVLDVHRHGVHDRSRQVRDHSRQVRDGGPRRSARTLVHRAPLRVSTVLMVSRTMTTSSAIDRFLM